MTKYLAFEGGVMTSPDTTIEINEVQYLAAIEAMTQGKIVTINGGYSITDLADPEATGETEEAIV